MKPAYDQDRLLQAEYRKREVQHRRHHWKTRGGAQDRISYLRGAWNRIENVRPITLPTGPGEFAKWTPPVEPASAPNASDE